MSSNRLTALGPVAALLVLGGCNTTQPLGDEDPFLGEAVKYNAAVQTINPAPVYPPDAARPGDNGEVGANAVERYRKGTVKPVEMMGTTTSSGGSSGPR